jgi:glycosyltransferase involved in cell wall biosynthesis
VDNHLRICYLSNNFSPIVGGAEAQAEKQARQLQALGHEMTVVTLRIERRLKRQEVLAGLPVVRVGGLYKRSGRLRTGKLGHLPIALNMFLVLWRLRHTYDIIHAFQFSPIAAVAVLICKLTHKPVVVNLQSAGPCEMELPNRGREAMLMADTLSNTDFLKIDHSMSWAIGGSDLTRLPQVTFGGRAILNFLRRSDAFYRVLSTRCFSYLISQKFRADHIVRIPNGVNSEKFRPLAEQRPDATGPERIILCVARLEYPKGVDVLLHAWGRMMRAPQEWRASLTPRLCIVGDGRFKPQMERMVTELGIQESVEFLGLRKDVLDLLRSAWGFVLPSRWEGMPNALLEAMACGLPCVATRVSGSEDIITHGINGLLVQPEQPAEMAQALRRLLEDPGFARHLGQEGRNTILREYQLSNVVEQCLSLYQRVLQGSTEGNSEADGRISLSIGKSGGQK